MFIRAKVENVGIHKVIVDGEACINIMSHFSLKKIRKRDTVLKPHNMVLSNYEGMTGKNPRGHLGRSGRRDNLYTYFIHGLPHQGQIQLTHRKGVDP